VERAAAQRDREEGQVSQSGQEWDGPWHLHLPEMINKRAVRARLGPRGPGRPARTTLAWDVEEEASPIGRP
jgi:hypothetical protein